MVLVSYIDRLKLLLKSLKNLLKRYAREIHKGKLIPVKKLDKITVLHNPPSTLPREAFILGAFTNLETVVTFSRSSRNHDSKSPLNLDIGF